MNRTDFFVVPRDGGSVELVSQLSVGMSVFSGDLRKLIIQWDGDTPPQGGAMSAQEFEQYLKKYPQHTLKDI